ncbi:MAG: IS630 family transposase [Fimbriimonadaceae bacterium]|nr:IS630 family transposase [Burkholderiales bacterium]MCZ7581787.1 IS630 family transposase [Fimbriimonadaceae bacterium]
MASGRPKQSLDLTAQERAQLESIVASRSLPHGLVRRARMILLTEDGVSVRETARRVKVSAPAVSNWRKRFREQRLAGLHDALKSGRPRTHDEERIAQLLNRALVRRPKAATHWSVRTLAEDTGISKSTVQRYLSLFGVQPHRARSFKLSNDPFFIEKVREVVGLYLNPPDNALVLCVDEKSQVQALERTQPVLPMGLGYVEGITHDYVRHGTTTLFAALNIANGQVFTQCKPRHRHQEFLSFLRHIDASVPKSLDVHLIVDNYGTHKHARVRAWLARRPRFHVHYTPTYSSWLNQVERWFGLITQRAIRRGSFSSVTDLRRQIERFVVEWNQHPKPFVWTATAQSILAKLERLGKVICGTQH